MFLSQNFTTNYHFSRVVKISSASIRFCVGYFTTDVTQKTAMSMKYWLNQTLSWGLLDICVARSTDLTFHTFKSNNQI